MLLDAQHAVGDNNGCQRSAMESIIVDYCHGIIFTIDRNLVEDSEITRCLGAATDISRLAVASDVVVHIILREVLCPGRQRAEHHEEHHSCP